MSIGKLTTTAIVLVLSLGGCTRNEANNAKMKPDESWWITMELEATKNHINGIAVSKINKNWKQVQILHNELFKSSLTKSQYTQLQNSSLSFSVKNNIEGTLHKLAFFVGVYESNSGDKGRFIAISRNDEIVKYFEHAGFSGYSSVYLSDNTIHWYKCMECGDYDTIYWTGTDYAIR